MNQTSGSLINQFICHVEAFTLWVQQPERKKIILYICIFWLLAVLIWGMLFVPRTVLQNSTSAQSVVEFTSTLFPWMDARIKHHGVLLVGKFVYLQCISIWLLAIPNFFLWLIYSPYPQLNLGVHGKPINYFPWGTITLLCMIYINMIDSYSTISRVERTMFSAYFSANLASVLSLSTLVSLIMLFIAVLYKCKSSEV